MSGSLRRRPARLACEEFERREVPAILYAVAADQRLLTFDSSDPSTLLGTVRITGQVRAGERITDLDVRPSTGGLYGRSDDGRVYLIDTLTGAATLLNGGVTAPGEAGFDFNPVSDRIRVINTSGQNVLVDPNTGAIATVGLSPAYRSGDLFAGVRPQVVALAHTSSNSLVSPTRLFGIDYALNTLVVSVNQPNGVQLATVGSLGIDVAPAVGFDIDPNGQVGYATFRVPGGANSSFFSVVDLNTGAASVIGRIGPGPRIFDIAVSRTQTSANPLPPIVDARSLGFATTDLGATFDSVFGTPFDPNPVLPGTAGTGLNIPPTSGLFPGLVQPLTGTLTSPLAPGLVGQPIASFGNSLTTFGASFPSVTGTPLGSVLSSTGTQFDSFFPSLALAGTFNTLLQF